MVQNKHKKAKNTIRERHHYRQVESILPQEKMKAVSSSLQYIFHSLVFEPDDAMVFSEVNGVDGCLWIIIF